MSGLHVQKYLRLGDLAMFSCSYLCNLARNMVYYQQKANVFPVKRGGLINTFSSSIQKLEGGLRPVGIIQKNKD